MLLPAPKPTCYMVHAKQSTSHLWSEPKLGFLPCHGWHCALPHTFFLLSRRDTNSELGNGRRASLLCGHPVTTSGASSGRLDAGDFDDDGRLFELVDRGRAVQHPFEGLDQFGNDLPRVGCGIQAQRTTSSSVVAGVSEAAKERATERAGRLRGATTAKRDDFDTAVLTRRATLMLSCGLTNTVCVTGVAHGPLQKG